MQQKLLLFSFLYLLGSSFVTPFSFAQEAEKETPQAEDATVQFEQLFKAVKQNPDNLDINFEYASLAMKLGKYDEAIASYERMLIIKPDLQRVKLDMAIAYMKASQPLEAKKIFEEVMASDPPAQVQDNIQVMLSQIDKAVKRHRFSGTVGFGFNSDSNANSAPGSGEVSIVGLNFALDESGRSASDDHMFSVLSLNHQYLMEVGQKDFWKSTFSVYKTKQSSMRNLDLTAYSFKTGPSFVLSPRLRLGLTAGYSDVNLADQDYLRTNSYEIATDYLVTPKVKFNATVTREQRRYQNAPEATTYADRSGYAFQESLGLTVAATKKDIINANLMFRQESTAKRYNDNSQKRVRIGYTRILPKDMMINTHVTFRKSQYKEVDPVVDPNKIRSEVERSYGITLAKKLTKKDTVSVGYQYKDITAEIPNYDYENERVSINYSRRF